MNKSQRLGLLVSSVALISTAPAVDSYRQSLLRYQLQKKTSVASPQLSINDNETSEASVKTNIMSSYDMLSEFKEDGFPISAIASMIGVERKTVYAWLNGTAMKPSNEERVDEIYKLLTQNKVASFKNLYRYLNRNINGQTLNEALTHAPINHGEVRDILTELWPLSEKIERSLSSNSQTLDKENPVIRELTELSIS